MAIEWRTSVQCPRDAEYQTVLCYSSSELAAITPNGLRQNAGD